MFPESFVQKHLVWSKRGDLVLDPFSGRGTTVFEALLGDRDAIAGDTNPVAVCVSRAKADPPELDSICDRLEELERASTDWQAPRGKERSDEFFKLCFAPSTLKQLLFLKSALDWQNGRTDRFIAALALGCLHGESHRSKWCFSNRMPRTISTKPVYSVQWWQKNRCLPPNRDVFDILKGIARYRFVSPLPQRRGRVASSDARRLAGRFPDAKNRVSLVITSPPYLDTTSYREDQWLRLWFLGGPSRPTRAPNSDDRHRGESSYWIFLQDAWTGIAPLLKDGAHVIVRIGGRHIDKNEVSGRLHATLKYGLGATVKLREQRSSKIVNGQLQAFRPEAKGTQVEHDFHYCIS